MGHTTPETVATEIDAIDYSDFVVVPDYIDPNGHMNVGYYSLLFDRALDRPWERLGIYSQTMLERGFSTFALESHLTYSRELKLDDPIDFVFGVLDYDSKRIHYWQAMKHAVEGWTASVCEQISMCIDMNVRRSTTWPADTAALIAALHEAHRQRERPAEIGRVIAIRRR
jgi:acyl-CoA thioester hydrolase